MIFGGDILIKGKVALLFPGSGSHYSGMGKALYEEFDIAKKTFEEASDVLGMDFAKLCFKGNIRQLNKIENMLPALFTVSIALFRVYMEEIGVVPQLAAGHSLGEYSALTSCGAIEFSDALRLVHVRSLLAKEVALKEEGTMTIVNGLHDNIIREVCDRISKNGNIAQISCYNSKDQVLLSGHSETLLKVEETLSKMGAQCIPLIGSAPYHSILMQPAAEALRVELLKCRYKEMGWNIISNVTALPYESSNKIVENLVLQMTRPVLWNNTIEYLIMQGVETIVEIGPQSVLKKLIDTNYNGIRTFAFDLSSDRQKLREIVAEERKSVNKKREITVITRCLAAAACTENRNWNDQEYQKGVIEPYDKIQTMQDYIEKEGTLPNVGQMYEALELLRKIFSTKKVSIEEQIMRYNYILDSTGYRKLLSDFIMPTVTENV